MNWRQRIALWIGLAAFSLLGLFPPWVFVFHSTQMQFERPMGMACIFNPPQPYEVGYGEGGTQIETTTLLVEWIVVTVATSGMYVSLKATKHMRRADVKISN